MGIWWQDQSLQAGCKVAKPVINWTSFFWSLPGQIISRVHFFCQIFGWCMPWEDQEKLTVRRRPLSLVGNVKTPTMLLTGEKEF